MKIMRKKKVKDSYFSHSAGTAHGVPAAQCTSSDQETFVTQHNTVWYLPTAAALPSTNCQLRCTERSRQ